MKQRSNVLSQHKHKRQNIPQSFINIRQAVVKLTAQQMTPSSNTVTQKTPYHQEAKGNYWKKLPGNELCGYRHRKQYNNIKRTATIKTLLL